MKRGLIWIGSGAGLLMVGLVGSLILVGSRGNQSWGDFKREAAERGEMLEVADFTVPPVVLDERNFAATPFFQPFFKGREEAKEAGKRIDLDALAVGEKRPTRKWYLGELGHLAGWRAYLGTENLREVLAPFSPVIEELKESRRRPKTQFPMDLTEGMGFRQPHLDPLIKVSAIVMLRARVALEEGSSKGALDDIELIFSFAEAVRTRPITVISCLVEVALLTRGTVTTWEGLSLHQWDKPQLARLKQQLLKYDIFKDGQDAFRLERALQNQEWKRAANLYGNRSQSAVVQELNRIWTTQNQLDCNEYFQRLIDALSRRPIKQKGLKFEATSLIPKHPFSIMFTPSMDKVVMKFARAQSLVEQALIGCELEEYRIDNGAFPETLDALVPHYLKTLPLDPMTEKPQIYRRTDDGSYLLYSVGWNFKDDAGTVALKNGGKRQDDEQGDWVWFGSPQIDLTKE